MKRILAVVFPVTILAVMGVASISPAFPVIREALGLSTREVGLLITVFTVPGVIFTPLYGILIDRTSRRKVLIPVLLLYGIAGCLVPVFSSFRIMLVFRFLQGIGNAPLTTLALTLIGDRFKGDERNSIMGKNAAVLSIATALFPAIGGALTALSWRAPFFLPVFAVIVAFVALGLAPAEAGARNGDARAYLKKAMASLRSGYIISLYICAFLVFCILFGSFLTYFTFFLAERFELNSLLIGVTVTFMSLSTAAVSFNLGRLVKRFGAATLMIVAFVLYALTMAVMPFITALWLVYVVVAFFGIAQGFAIPVLQILVSGYAPPEQKAVFLSLYSVVMNGGAALGPVLAGLLFRAAGYTGSFALAAGLAVVALLVVLAVVRRALYDQRAK